MRTDHDDGSITLVCECPEGPSGPACGYTQTFESEEVAFQEGWDGVGAVSSWRPSCPLCPGMAATFKLVDHSEAHAKWETDGRPAEFSTEGIKEKP